MTEACPEYNFFHPTRVEGLSVVAHGLASSQTFVGTSSAWPVVVYVTDITVNPIPVHIPEELQHLLNLKESPILTAAMIDDIKTIHTDITKMVKAIVTGTIQGEQRTKTLEIAKSSGVEILQDSSDVPSYDTKDTFVNKAENAAIDQTEIDSITVYKSVEADDVDLANNPVGTSNDISSTENEDKLTPLAYDDAMDFPKDDLENNFEDYGENVHKAEDVQNNDEYKTEETENARLCKTTFNDMINAAPPIQKEENFVLSPQNVADVSMNEPTDCGISSTEIHSTKSMETTETSHVLLNENRSSNLSDNPLPSSSNAETILLSSNMVDASKDDGIQNSVNRLENVNNEEMEYTTVDVTVETNSSLSEYSSVEQHRGIQQKEQQVDETKLDQTIRLEPENSMTGTEILQDDHRLSPESSQPQSMRRRTKIQLVEPGKLRRSPRLAKKKRVQYFPLTRRANQSRC